MVSPVDSDGLPGSHRSAGARPSARLEGAEEAADQRVWAAMAHERAQHVSCSASVGLTFIAAACLSALTALAAVHCTQSLQCHDQSISSGSCRTSCMAALCQTASVAAGCCRQSWLLLMRALAERRSFGCSCCDVWSVMPEAVTCTRPPPCSRMPSCRPALLSLDSRRLSIVSSRLLYCSQQDV